MALYVVSGLSGSGKSTVLKWLKEYGKLKPNSAVIDQDSYFYSRQGKKHKMPNVRLSSGQTTINYDSPLSIDNKKLEEDVKLHLSEGKNVYLSGFIFRSGMYDLNPDLHFHIIIGKEMSLQRREQSKNYTNDFARNKDKMMMEEVIFPEYLETLRLSKIDYYLDGTKQIRQNGDFIVTKINDLPY